MNSILDWFKAGGVVVLVLFVLYALWIAALFTALIIAVALAKVYFTTSRNTIL